MLFLPMSITAFRLLFGHLAKAELQKAGDNCPTPIQGKLPFQLQYLGGYAPAVENTLCILVAFFHPLFQPEAANHTPFMLDFLASFPACIIIPFLEASRLKRSLLMGFPAIMGTIYQLFSGAVAFPMYWAVFLATMRDHATDSQIVQADAEGILFGVVMGYFLPTFAMTYMATTGPIALWQVFPLLVSLFGNLHRLLRPRSLHGGSGHRTVQATYVLMLLTSAIVHLRTLKSYNFDLQTIMTHLIPSLEIPDAKKGHTALTSIIHFLQWDAVFIFGSTFVASLWFARSVGQGVLLIVWIVISTAVLGPGAAVSGIFLWREEKLNQARRFLTPKLAKAQ
ncbi:hypothetical protein JB92DRAFT_3028842 [Gautieria morchelliformis]|nr:hypothetical protein JB92DRAFT_3028842 [Gautieria morchelliformis]